MSGPPSVLCPCGHLAAEHGFGCDVPGCDCPAAWWDLGAEEPVVVLGQLEFDEEAA